MTDTTVAYHADGYAAARPAINVKVHAAGVDYWPAALERAYGDLPDADAVQAAYDRVQSDFWQAAEEIAMQRGLGEITQEGRSGGWLVFTQYDPYIDPDDDTVTAVRRAEVERSVWMDGYRSMVEWADAWIADAPRKVAHLAQQYAMDEAGEPAAKRMFAFGRNGMSDTITLRVEWDTTGCDCEGPPPPVEVVIPRDVYYDGAIEWNDPVAEWLSNRYGFLVTDWRLA